MSQAVSAPTAYLSEKEGGVRSEGSATSQRFDLQRSAATLLVDAMRQTPDQTGFICGEEQLPYRELLARAGAIAAGLQRAGLVRGESVGVLMQRSADLPCTLLGIWMAGGAYVPLDPLFPQERLQYIVADSGMRLIVADPRSSDRVPKGAAAMLLVDTLKNAPAQEAPLPLAATAPAYIMYTSGSTGKPKGVVVPHGAVVNLLLSMQQHPFVARGARLLSVTTYAFDISILELWLPLLCGGTTVLARAPADPLTIWQELTQYDIGVMQATPVTWQLLLSAGWPGKADLIALCGGEALQPALLQALRPRVAQLWNMYGPTETTVWSSCCAVENSDEQISVGRPIANTTFYVLDARLKPVPPGGRGELYIGGSGLALGYHNRADLTADKFIPDPFSHLPGARLYRTGDLASVQADQTFVVHGRTDHQVKVRGYRLELGEVEAALAACPGVAAAAATVWEEQGQQVLAGYYTVHPGAHITAEDLQRECRRRLPEYMVPSHCLAIEALPLTPNRKVDRAALPRPPKHKSVLTHEPEQAGLQPRILALWRELLGTDAIGLHDPFFTVGGNSFTAFLLVRGLSELTGKKFPLLAAFEHPTVSAQAAYLSDKQGKDSPTAAVRQRARRQRAVLHASGTGDVAIVGMAGRFPKAANCPMLWQNLCNGVESITTWNRAELDPLVSPELRDNPNYIPARGIVDGVEQFDAAFFGINPKEACFMDPQLRLFLQTAWHALEDANVVAGDPSRPVGVFAGMGNNFYYHYNVLSNPAQLQVIGEITAEILNEKDHIAPIVSYKLNLTGPSLSVLTACSSTLVVVENAWRSLVTRQCDIAIAGGVDIRTPQKSGQLYEDGGVFSQDGHCRPFDASSTGTMFGEAVAAITLMRLDDALAQGRPIYAVIKGAAVNHDGGTKVSYLAPSIEAQMRVIAEAHELSGVSADTISCIEAHGTATPVGDPIEFEALTRVFREQSDKRGYCALGSVKANLGHTTTAAGITGVIKAALMLHHRTLVPQINFATPNPRIDLANSPFYIATTLRPWESGPTPRRAGISSFGFCGTNAHVVLEEAPASAVCPPAEHHPPRPLLFLLSARSTASLDAASGTMITMLQSSTDAAGDTTYSLACGRTRLEHRRAVAAHSAAEAADLLQRRTPLRVVDKKTDQNNMRLAFLFPGQGSQYVNMGLSLYQKDPHFREDVDRCAHYLQPHMGLDIREYLYPPPGDEEKAAQSLRDTFFTQPAIFTIEYSLARLWMRWGLEPAALLGHSIGEFVAATLAGIFDLDKALMMVATRASLMQKLPAGIMLAVRKAATDVLPLLPPDLSIAAMNGPQLCVVSGPTDTVTSFQQALEAQGTVCRPLHTSHAFHSSMMEPVVAPLADVVRGVELRPPQIPIVSTVSGTWLTPQQACDPLYWATHLRRTVHFSQAVQVLLPQATMCCSSPAPAPPPPRWRGNTSPTRRGSRPSVRWGMAPTGRTNGSLCIPRWASSGVPVLTWTGRTTTVAAATTGAGCRITISIPSASGWSRVICRAAGARATSQRRPKAAAPSRPHRI
jgi:amino acid adenylation domain-containing protein